MSLGPPRRWRGAPRALGARANSARDLAPEVRAGDTVFTLEDGSLLLLFASARGVPAHLDPVLAVGEGWSTLENPGVVPAGTIVIAEGGVRRALPFPRDAVPLHTLDDWSGWRVEPVEVLRGAPLPPPPVVYGLTARFGAAPAATPDDPGTRARLGDGLAALGGGVLGWVFRWWAPRPGAPQRIRLPPLARGALEWLVGLFLVPLVALGALLGALVRRLPSFPVVDLSPFTRWLDDLLGLTVALAGLGSAAGSAILALWRGVGGPALADALSRAVPLGGPAGAPVGGWFWGRVSARTTLREARQGLLRRLYQEAHARLDAEGDVERAAWVLGWLIGDAPAAVTYLDERLGPLAAARLAEELHLPADAVIGRYLAARSPIDALRVALVRGALDAAAPFAVRHAAASVAAGVGDLERAITLVWADREAAPELHGWAAALAAGPGVAAELGFVAATALGTVDPQRIATRVSASEDIVDPRGSGTVDPSRRAGEAPDAGSARVDRGPGARQALARATLTLRVEVPALGGRVLRALLADAGAAVPGAAEAAGRLVREGRRGLPPLLALDVPALPGPTAPLAFEGTQAIRLPQVSPGNPGIAACFGADLFVEARDGRAVLHCPGHPPEPLPGRVDRLVPGPGLVLLLDRAGRVAALGQDARLREIGAVDWDPVAAVGLPSLTATGLWTVVTPRGPALFAVTEDGLSLLWRGERPARACRGLALNERALYVLFADVAGNHELWTYGRDVGLRLIRTQEICRGWRDAPVSPAFGGLLIVGPREELRVAERVVRGARREGVALEQADDTEFRWHDGALTVTKGRATLRILLPGQVLPPFVQRLGDHAIHVRDGGGRSVRIDLATQRVERLGGG